MENQIGFEIAPSDEATDAILETIDKVFFNDEVITDTRIQIEAKLSNFFEKELPENIYSLIEYPYVDKVYRDSYYNYYASKHYSYKRDCIRVSLFYGKITGEMFLNPTSHHLLRKHYKGYFIIRPLKNAIFGRSHLNIELFKTTSQICSFESRSMILGVKFKTFGFPHSSQNQETITCAETTIWGLMEYFGSKYPDYTPSLPSEIMSSLKPIIFERQLPSIGLTTEEISYSLKDFGFGTRIYSTEGFDGDMFDNIHYYIESGIPIVLTLEADEKDEDENIKNIQGHAVIAIGKNYEDKTPLNKIESKTFSINGRDYFNYIDFANINQKIIIQDDNLFPYREVSLDNIGEHYDDEDLSSNYQVDAIVVPLYPKIYLEATLAKKMSLSILADPIYGYKFENGFVFRFFLTSSRSFKSHLSSLTRLDKDLKYDILGTKMPKFIWCSEIYQDYENCNEIKIDEKRNKIADGLIIIDATEANKESSDALIFAGYPNRCISLIENKFVTLGLSLSYYTYYNNFKKEYGSR
ncbi:hypothetical protein [Polaribacter cellanae]|uniref:Uncharacterized protein n=1 Tax=Polaribacter cellanae TaxID=2818493 RepID=A0A975CKX8_9FLAO|nr:hypothetical protein [Polaribacter cellanae]QTE21130.1 hypothetical protein J3359_09730 [Polaribacter cellanae]